MPGGPSQVDTFDYKPMIAKHAGERPDCVDRKSLRNTKMGLMPSPFGFQQYGECGKWVSDIFPEVAKCVDDISFVHSMHTDIPEHAGGILMTNLGALQPNRPSLGAWLTYGLGAETENLPGFVAMSPRAQPRGKMANWGNAFLPGAYAGTLREHRTHEARRGRPRPAQFQAVTRGTAPAGSTCSASSTSCTCRGSSKTRTSRRASRRWRWPSACSSRCPRSSMSRRRARRRASSTATASSPRAA